jgi:hypothetical protein
MGQEAEINAKMRRDEALRLMGAIRPFGSVPACPKCGSEVALTSTLAWCAGKSLLNEDPKTCQVHGQHVHRFCNQQLRGCGYGWMERPKDWTPEDEAEHSTLLTTGDDQ